MISSNAWFALGAALLWGGGDFAGGMGVKTSGGGLGAALRVVLLSHSTSLCVLLLIAKILGDAAPTGAPLAWGLCSGVAVGISITLFYLALSRGGMGASAAVSGLLAAAIPAVVSGWTEGAPGLQRLAGFLLAGLAIWLIAGGGAGAERGTLILAIVSGAGFGIYFVALKFAGVAGVVWPMVTTRMASLTVCAMLLAGVVMRERRAGARARMGVSRAVVLWAMGTALLDTGGNMMFVAATRAGRLDVASVLASLYPASTILLAAWTLRESPTRRQGLGMGLAVAAVVLITL